MSRRICSITSSMIMRLALALVEVELLDDALEPRAAEDLLADHVAGARDSSAVTVDWTKFSGTRCGTMMIEVDAR